MVETEKSISENCPAIDDDRQMQTSHDLVEVTNNKRQNLIALITKDNEKLIPLFFPCYLVAIGFIVLTGINIIDPALLESANWKQNTIWCALLFFGLLPPNMRSTKGVWMIMGYVLAFFTFGGGNVFGTVKLVLAAFKIFLPILILFQMVRLWAEIKQYGKWILLLPVTALIFTLLLYPIEDHNILQSSWNTFTNWSWDFYRSDYGFHTYLGCIGVLAGITEYLIVRKYIID